MEIIDILSFGKENAKSARYLQSILGYRYVREVTSEINRLRKKGVIICSSTDATSPGYYFPSDEKEIYEFVRQMDSRIKDMSLAVSSAKEALGYDN